MSWQGVCPGHVLVLYGVQDPGSGAAAEFLGRLFTRVSESLTLDVSVCSGEPVGSFPEV